jgi:hypothetical protein
MTPDPLSYYALESYLLGDVRKHFEDDGSIGAFDFFSIVIWKANRAKSRIAERLRSMDKPEQRTDLEAITRSLTKSLYEAEDGQARLRILLCTWGFLLPMATAILSILWPDEFTVYDVRVCGELKEIRIGGDLKDFTDLANLSNVDKNFDKVWARYFEYRESVRAAVPQESSLRDKDRYLWGRSAARQVQSDIASGFPRRGRKS